mmetsp:Transcript_6773/g.11849  ORF Transcript_6773/g.11849 Transcript_6773/m.11849 type:complete len:393 (-) Transcript_6773:311-1489(-)|eukprot:CAMPEP_0201869506 /NCGR_PEP_ID=MMETSP0902-20130614/2997_1 /ASSEMBLY_ACC=CAM_ASM_000551 /TAXON_ID=420261 /ORGANISM="Thalassiosira antarctica, Strain CCMP982" /LENGTH=392 /DNA_ID=CAMNT_0048395025 /DNA_START=57 /DNA_END=1235 /DNA_ORIENTATION=-
MTENNTESGNGLESNVGGEVNALHDLFAGGVAGSASVIVGHPFDTIKVRLQTSTPSSGNSTTKTASNNHGSFRSLFKGMAAPLSTAAVVNAIIFASYGSFTRLWEDSFENGRHDKSGVHGAVTGEGAVFIDRDEHGIHEQMKDWEKGNIVRDSSSQIDSESPPHVRRQQEAEQQKTKQIEKTSELSSAGSARSDTLKVFMCGAAAGTVQAFVICPMEHIKCRLQVQSSTQQLYKGPVDACISIVKKYGFFSGLYRGMGVTLWRETPAFGMYFATYDTIKAQVERLLEEKDENHPIPSHAHAWAASALAGGISGAWTWAIIYPFDVIKTRIQTGPLESHLRKGMWTVAYDIVQEHGWKRMFRGIGVTLARAFPVNAIIFPVYEAVLIQLGDGD